jgi:hypothetical protein
MTLYIDIETRQFRKGLTSAAVLPSIIVKRGDDLDVSLQFVSGFSAVTAGSGATGKLAIKREPADDYFLALAASWTAPGSGQTAYSFALDLFTDEMEEVFETEPATVSAVLEIEWVTASETVSSVSLPVTIQNHVIRGSEGTPTPATSPTPVVEVISDVPDAKDDFFMFPGGVAPTTGMYMASDANYNYTMKGGWTYWRRAAIAMWLMLAAMTLAAGAQYDMPYIQQDGSGDNQERVVTLTPSTFLSVSANGTLEVQSGVNFKTSLGLATVATSGNYSDLSGTPSLFSGNFTDLSGKPTTLEGYGILNSIRVFDAYGGLPYTDATMPDNTPVLLRNEETIGFYTPSRGGFLEVPTLLRTFKAHSASVWGSSAGTSVFDLADALAALQLEDLYVDWDYEANNGYIGVGNATIGMHGNALLTLNNGTLTLSGSTLTLSGNATLSGNNTGDQDLTGLPTLAGNNTFTGNNTFGQLNSANQTVTGNVTVNGSTTLGDATGDTLTISGPITAAGATSTNATSVANVGALDARYGNFYVLRMAANLTNNATSPTVFSTESVNLPVGSYAVDFFIRGIINSATSGITFGVTRDSAEGASGTGSATYQLLVSDTYNNSPNVALDGNYQTANNGPDNFLFVITDSATRRTIQAAGSGVLNVITTSRTMRFYIQQRHATDAANPAIFDAGKSYAIFRKLP